MRLDCLARVFLLSCLLGSRAATAAAPCFEAIGNQELPAAVEWAKDVRWLARDRLLLAVSNQGTYEVDPGRTSAANLLFAKASDSPGPVTVAASETHFLIGAPVWSYLEAERNGDKKTVAQAIDSLVDADLAGSRLALAGTQRGLSEYAPDGAIAWLDQIGTAPEKMRPLFYSESGPGASTMARCGILGLSAIRFLKDGSIVFTPGVEGGVYQYAADGRLQRTWTAEKVGFDSGCPLSEQEFKVLAVFEQGRWDWVNERRVVEDIIPLPEGPGILVRHFKDGVPSWELKVLKQDGTIRTCPVPVKAPSRSARIKADVFQDQIGILLFENGYAPNKARKVDTKTGATTEIPQVLHPSQPPQWIRLKYLP